MLDLLTLGPEFMRPTGRAAAAAIDYRSMCAVGPRPTSAANPPAAAAAAVDQWDTETDGQTDGHLTVL